MKNCAIYTRVSTDNQAEKEFSSCEAQEQKIRSFSLVKTIGKFLRFTTTPDFLAQFYNALRCRSYFQI